MNALELRRRTLGKGVYKKTVEGNPAIAQGSLSRRNPGITMQGWTEQAQYEGNQLFDKSGIVLTGNIQYIPVNVGDGEFTLSTQYNNTYRKDVFFLPGNVSDGASGSENGVGLNNPKTATSENGYVTVGLRTNSEGDMNPLDYNIMLNAGSTALPYEPYTGGAPSPSPEYPQPITSAGKYNEETQKWEYEITITNAQTDPDKNQTVTLTADRPLTKWDKLEKRNGQWGWVYKSDEYIFDNNSENLNCGVSSIGEEINSFYAEFPNKMKGGTDVFSNKFKYDYGAWNAVGHLYGLSGHPASVLTYFKVSKDIDTFTAFRDWMIENQVSVLYETEKETFVPLSESEQEAMNALHTFRPTTVLSNNCECNMELTYKTKKSLEVAT